MPDTTVVVIPLWKALKSLSRSAQNGARRWARSSSAPSA